MKPRVGPVGHDTCANCGKPYPKAAMNHSTRTVDLIGATVEPGWYSQTLLYCDLTCVEEHLAKRDGMWRGSQVPHLHPGQMMIEFRCDDDPEPVYAVALNVPGPNDLVSVLAPDGRIVRGWVSLGAGDERETRLHGDGYQRWVIRLGNVERLELEPTSIDPEADRSIGIGATEVET